MVLYITTLSNVQYIYFIERVIFVNFYFIFFTKCLFFNISSIKWYNVIMKFVVIILYQVMTIKLIFLDQIAKMSLSKLLHNFNLTLYVAKISIESFKWSSWFNWPSTQLIFLPWRIQLNQIEQLKDSIEIFCNLKGQIEVEW